MKLRFWLIAASLYIPSFASADFINGDFESPALQPGSQLLVSGHDIPGWLLSSGASLITNQFVGDGVTWNPTPDGNQFLYENQDVDGGVILSQTVSLVSGSNTLSFLQADFGSTFISPGGELTVSVTDSSNNLIVSPQLFSTPNFSGFIAQSLTFNVATSGDYTFEFTSIANHAAILDDVSVAGAAPEPASFFALGLGVAIFQDAPLGHDGYPKSAAYGHSANLNEAFEG